MPRFRSRREGLRDTLFGFAAGSQIIVCLSRVEEVAKDAGPSRAQILTIVITHEIVHVLLGPKSHSTYGIMRSQWNREESVLHVAITSTDRLGCRSYSSEYCA